MRKTKRKEKTKTHLRAESVNELHVVRDNADSSSPVSDSDGKTSKGLSIQAKGKERNEKRKSARVDRIAGSSKIDEDSQVGRLIKNENLRVIPEGSGDDDLDLLSSGESLDLRVHSVISLESDVLEVLLDEVSSVVSGSGSL